MPSNGNKRRPVGNCFSHEHFMVALWWPYSLVDTNARLGATDGDWLAHPGHVWSVFTELLSSPRSSPLHAVEKTTPSDDESVRTAFLDENAV